MRQTTLNQEMKIRDQLYVYIHFEHFNVIT